MKKLILFGATLLLCASALTIKAQDNPSRPHSKFYLKAAGGYFFSVSPGQFPNVGPYPPQDLHTEYNPLNANPLDTISRKILTGSYGEGVRGGLTFGYNINKYLSVEGTFNYFHSRKNLMTRQETVLAGSGRQLGFVESRGHVNAVDFAPSLVVSPGYEKINPYVRFGVVLPLWGRLYIETEAAQTSTPPAGLPVPPGSQIYTTISRKEEVKPNVTIGFQGAFGVSFMISKRFDVFVEAEYRNVPVKSKSKEITRYDEVNTLVGSDGTAIQELSRRGLNDLSVAEKNTDYVTTLDQNSNTQINQQGTVIIYKDDNKPSNDLKSYINIGGLGANAGLKFRL